MIEQEKDALLERLAKEYAEKDKLKAFKEDIYKSSKKFKEIMERKDSLFSEYGKLHPGKAEMAPRNTPTGWICPKCGRGMAPSAHHCPCVPLPPPVVTY